MTKATGSKGVRLEKRSNMALAMGGAGLGGALGEGAIRTSSLEPESQQRRSNGAEADMWWQPSVRWVGRHRYHGGYYKAQVGFGIGGLRGSTYYSSRIR